MVEIINVIAISAVMMGLYSRHGNVKAMLVVMVMVVATVVGTVVGYMRMK